MSTFTVSEEIAQLYGETYKGESQWRRLCAMDKASNILSLCCSVPHNKILDIGSGEGSILRILSELSFGEALYSLEIAPTAVKAITDGKIPSLVECRLFDGYTIPYARDSFDLVILSHVLEHVEYPRKLLYEAGRVSRAVFIEVPLEDTFRLSPDYVPSSVGHINFYSRKTIRRLVQTSAFVVIRQVSTNHSKAVYVFAGGAKGIVKHTAKDLLLRISEPLATRIFTYHCALLCAKK